MKLPTPLPFRKMLVELELRIPPPVPIVFHLERLGVQGFILALAFPMLPASLLQLCLLQEHGMRDDRDHNVVLVLAFYHVWQYRLRDELLKLLPIGLLLHEARPRVRVCDAARRLPAQRGRKSLDLYALVYRVIAGLRACFLADERSNDYRHIVLAVHSQRCLNRPQEPRRKHDVRVRTVLKRRQRIFRSIATVYAEIGEHGVCDVSPANIRPRQKLLHEIGAR
mmetsp:Transcript_52175/g.158518  ORF Transcript_52175/g.158518 Transcript_52175/m.158518 type:complete len:224 (+) Transcript_52175:317-988(+)